MTARTSSPARERRTGCGRESSDNTPEKEGETMMTKTEPKNVKKDTCKHFNGVQNSRCDADVNYRELAGPPNAGYVARLPCWVNSLSDKPQPKVTCEKFCLPSAQEINDWERYVQEHIKRQMKANPLIVAFKKEYKGRSGSVVKTCPVCGGNLHMSIARYNGHVHGKCETDKCLWWME